MSQSSPKVGFVSLGCPKALVDSERILTQLRTDGYQIAPDYDDADVVVVNTCGFIDSAKEESLQAIGEALDANGRVIVTGCMGAQPSDITSIHPKVLAVTGPHQYEEVVGAVHQATPKPRVDPRFDLVPDHGIKLTPRHYAYLKIAEGCNHKCTFCIIPDMRGKLVSRPIDHVLAEAHRLVRAGVRELLVISQDTSAYGIDTRYKERTFRDKTYATRFEDLCHGLAETGAWVRLHYVYPYPHVDRIIPLMAEGRILPYLDIPFQHASPRILKLMKRPASASNNLERINAWRAICPDLTIRSTFIVGFPGETEAEFEELLAFLREARIDRLGCFKYSPVEGARANDLPEQIEESVKQERWERLMELQAGISAERLQRFVGRRMEVMVDSIDGDDAIARGHADAPEIDGVVHVLGGGVLSPGDLVNVTIVAADEYDLQATA